MGKMWGIHTPTPVRTRGVPAAGCGDGLVAKGESSRILFAVTLVAGFGRIAEYGH
jgi:hypothetical protein